METISFAIEFWSKVSKLQAFKAAMLCESALHAQRMASPNLGSVLLCLQGTMKALFLRHEGEHQHIPCTHEDDVVPILQLTYSVP